MTVTDLIVIYIACGSPFGVYQATNREKDSAGVNWARVIKSFLFWPVFAIALLGGKIFPNEARSKVEFQHRIEEIRVDFEQTVFPGLPISSLFDYRETFYRFVGLTEAADEIQTRRSTAEIFEISGHNNKSLASRCLARKNLCRLSYHRSAAREEFVVLISRLTSTGSDRIQIVSLALELADHLHDQTAADAFMAMISVPQAQDGECTSVLEKEVWRSRIHSTSTIN